MNKYLILLVLVITSSACRKNNSVVVDGVVKDKILENIYIRRVDISTVIPVDSCKINSKGNSRFRVKTTESDFYQVGYSAADFITLLGEPGEKIRLVFHGQNLSDNYTVSGSKGSELVQVLDLHLIETKSKLDSLSIAYDKIASEPGSEAARSLLEQEYLNLLKEQRKFNIAFILENLKSLASIKALYQKVNDQTYVLYEARDLQFLKIVSDSLKRYYPESRHTKTLISDFEKEMKEFSARKFQEITSSLPETKLDPELKDISGRRIALSSLRGKYVLLTFWSSESRDCISENLQLKEFYRLYNRKGFEIYQISLDTDESRWKQAVRYDDLPWISTREDDPLNPKNAMIFNIKILPANYLFDKEGKIIASNLHGRSLKLKLEQLFNN